LCRNFSLELVIFFEGLALVASILISLQIS
jgi:hypothetical protein